MVFDLRRAFLKKQEFESARLMDFEFRQRARTFRLLAERLGLDPAALATRTAKGDDASVLGWIEAETKRPRVELVQLHGECSTDARKQLIAELGDPTPHRLL